MLLCTCFLRLPGDLSCMLSCTRQSALQSSRQPITVDQAAIGYLMQHTAWCSLPIPCAECPLRQHMLVTLKSFCPDLHASIYSIPEPERHIPFSLKGIAYTIHTVYTPLAYAPSMAAQSFTTCLYALQVLHSSQPARLMQAAISLMMSPTLQASKCPLTSCICVSPAVYAELKWLAACTI